MNLVKLAKIFIVSKLYCTVYSVQCTVYSVQCTCSFVSFCENKFTFKGVKSKIFNLVIQSNWSSDG